MKPLLLRVYNCRNVPRRFYQNKNEIQLYIFINGFSKRITALIVTKETQN